MRNVLKIAISVMAAVLLFSCQKPYVTSNELAVSQETILIPNPAGGHCYISVFSYTDWTIALEPVDSLSKVDWATLAQNSGSGTGYVRMEYSENTSGEERSAQIVVRTSTKECRITVKQPAE